jgi:hypothetical protein
MRASSIGRDRSLLLIGTGFLTVTSPAIADIRPAEYAKFAMVLTDAPFGTAERRVVHQPGEAYRPQLARC